MVAMMGGMTRVGAKKNALAIPTTAASDPGPADLDSDRANRVEQLRAQIAELETTNP